MPRVKAAPQALPLLPPVETPGDQIYAEVAVDVGGRGPDQLFTYAVPEALRERVRPGQRVRVPFGRREAQGVLFRLGAVPPPAGGVRPLGDLLDDEPPLDAHALALAGWLAERTVCSRAQAVRVLLPPPGAGPKQRLAYHPLPGIDPGRALARAPAQAAAWQALLAEPGLGREELARRGIGAAAVGGLVRRGWVEARAEGVRRDPLGAGWDEAVAGREAPAATPDQERALVALAPAIDGPEPTAFLLWGVTGSGKTEVYLQAIERVLARGRQAIVLVPEIALTPQTVRTFRERFGARVALLHSALGAGERHDEWWRVRRGEVGVVVGARSAVFAPLPRLGLIVIDEEHEPSYKQEESPRYHARDVARWRAERLGIPVLLGSATPAVETFEAAARGDLVRLDMPRRVGGRPLPGVRTLDLRAAPGEDLFAPELREALARHLGAGHQALLFLNRRGFAPALVCRACGHCARCQACSVALCYHDSDRLLHCHYCGQHSPVPRLCPRCGGHLLRLRGVGTERVAQEVVRLFPAARVLRMDLDTTGTKGAHRRIYEAFRAGRADVLVGTQMVAKGWDVAGVTLVGVVDADTALHHPDYRGAERTFQLLCQVAGRAGRGDEPGEVLVQTHTPDHPAIMAATAHDYGRFVREELAVRRAARFPPFASLLRILAWSPEARAAEVAARAVGEALANILPPGVDLWGPSQAPLARLRGQHRWHLALRGPDDAVLRALARSALDAVAGRVPGARLAADPDPQSMV